MRCPVCESTINDACRFCTVCGSPIEGPLPADAEGPLPGSSAAASTSETERARAAVEPQSSEANDAKASPSRRKAPSPGESGATDAEPATFAAVMDDTRRRSKRRIPLVVMLALAVALAAGTAFAAYQAYVNVIAPAQTQDRAQPSEPVAESPHPTSLSPSTSRKGSSSSRPWATRFTEMERERTTRGRTPSSSHRGKATP